MIEIEPKKPNSSEIKVNINSVCFSESFAIPNRLILLGDVKHQVPHNSRQQRKDLEELI